MLWLTGLGRGSVPQRQCFLSYRELCFLLLPHLNGKKEIRTKQQMKARLGSPGLSAESMSSWTMLRKMG